MSIVSWAMRACFHSGRAASVRMLWRRSASLMMRTRRSFAIATSILRMVAACCSSFESKRRRSSLVTPSTISAISVPKSRSTSPTVTAVSSTESCRRAAARVVSSSPVSATMLATASGWLMYFSPDTRYWPSWAWAATSKARTIVAVEALGWWLRYAVMRGASSSAAGGEWRRHGRTRLTVAIVALDAQERDDLVLPQPRATLQIDQLDDEPEPDDLAAQTLDEAHRRRRRPAGGEDVVD